MKRGAPILVLMAPVLLTAEPAYGCPPPIPGEVWPPPKPSDAEMAGRIFRGNSEIVYGEVIVGSDQNGGPLFRILHVYKGRFKRGQTIRGIVVHLQPVFCPGMIEPPPILKGVRGVIAFNGRPPAPLNFAEDGWVDEMLAQGLIKPSPRDRRRAKR